MSKFVCAAAPFIVLFGVFFFCTESPSALQHHVLDDKVVRLVTEAPEKVQVIFGGESSVERGFIPALFTTDTGLSSVNVAVGYGTLNEYYEDLKMRNILGQHRLLVVGLRSYQINDGFIGFQPLDKEIIAKEPLGIRKVQDSEAYYSYLFNFYFEHFKNFIRPDMPNLDLMDDTVFEQKGYVNNGDNTLTLPLPEQIDAWYASIHLGGLRQEEFINALDALGKTGDPTILFIGPIAPAWRDALAGTTGQETEDYFAQLTATEMAKYPNMHFIDFRYQNIPGLGNAQFADGVHLNDEGAHVFTSFMVHTLSAEGLLKKP